MFNKADDSELINAVKEGAFLVDVRTPAEFKAVSVKGSINIPLNTIPNQLSKFKDKKKIVVFCQSGGRCKQAKAILNQNGFDNVIDGKTWMKMKGIVEK